MTGYSTTSHRHALWRLLALPILAAAVLVLALGQGAAERALAGPGPTATPTPAPPGADVTGDWGFVYSVGGPPFIGSCVTVLLQSGPAISSTTNMDCEASGSPTAVGGVVTATMSGLGITGQVVFPGPVTINFSGTVSASGDEWSGSWADKVDPAPPTGSYAGLRLINTGVSPSPTTVTIPPSSSSGSGAAVTFGAVTVAGGTQVITGQPTGTALPQNFQLQPPGTIYNVVTTAVVTGSINVCINYQDKNNDGIVDGTSPAIAETSLQLLHEEGGTFVDRTVSAKKDHVNNTICAVVSSLSEFALGAQGAPPPVGGIALDGELSGLPLETVDSGTSAGWLTAVIAGATAVALVLGGSAWYARRRWLN